MSPDASLSERLAAAIAAQGPIPVAHYMAVAATHYYATRDPLGAEGDFTTAPEISQMFGEMIGLWFADLWIRMNKPRVAYVELGPGRGSLAVDALRAMGMVGLEPEVHLVETSPILKAKQAEKLPDAIWHDSLETLPRDRPLLVAANEFFDCLPVHQIVRGADGWYQRVIGHDGSRFTNGLGKQVPVDVIPEALRKEREGAVIETSPACVTIMRTLAQRIAAQGGIAAIIDYGYDGPQAGETVQAISRHAFADPFEDPGERDVTAHVDFETISAMAELCDARVQGPVAQGLWLKRLGIAERASALSEVSPEKADEFAGQLARLTKDDAMGRLFRVLAVRSPLWPEADGFGGVAGAG
jgi:NADH dehydrogenase [ubiquinone] 1 alpha subcomplex assembly factor 7